MYISYCMVPYGVWTTEGVVSPSRCHAHGGMELERASPRFRLGSPVEGSPARGQARQVSTISDVERLCVN